ncbi:MAG: cation transporter [Solirubrobacterales bacterium]|nr:cation transporter [Solirubrobacterales bacterium]HMT06002.1 cation diffusion facilitator family transporter [Solirubrobacterales bacterium]
MPGHNHDHGDHGHSHGPGAYRSTDRKALLIAAVLTAGFMLAEVAGGLLTDSLALLADAGHMLSDSFSLFLALGAVALAARPATAKRTFGFKRAEILAALVNGVLLVVVSVWIIVEAIHRIGDPPEVLGGWMLLVAVTGLAVNLVAAWVLFRSAGESLNVKAALRHVLADVAGSAGVILAALIILISGWELADPIVSIVISVLIAASAWSILRDSVDVLLEAAPPGMNTEEIGYSMAGLEGVEQVHDLHVWQITSGMPMLSAHVLVGPDSDCHAIRRDLEGMLRSGHGIEHTTLQVEHIEVQKPIVLE